MRDIRDPSTRVSLLYYWYAKIIKRDYTYLILYNMAITLIWMRLTGSY